MPNVTIFLRSFIISILWFRVFFFAKKQVMLFKPSTSPPVTFVTHAGPSPSVDQHKPLVCTVP